MDNFGEYMRQVGTDKADKIKVWKMGNMINEKLITLNEIENKDNIIKSVDRLFLEFSQLIE